MDLRVESPFPAWAWPLVWAWMQTFRDRVCDDYSPKTCGEFVTQMRAAAPEHTYAVTRGEDVGGLVWLPRVSPVVAFSHVVFARSFWGRDTTLEATRQAYGAAFDTGVEKICSTAFVDNHQVRSFAKLLGYREEGHRRQQTRRGGKPVDMIDFGLLKEDFYANWNSGRNADRICGERSSDRPLQPKQDQHVDEHTDIHD